jgi:hypothetical protein
MHDTKTCTKCKIERPPALFYMRRGGGLVAQCKPCTLARQKARRDADREASRAYHRAYYAANRAKAMARINAYRESEPRKAQARAAVIRAVRSGAMVRLPCERCGSTPSHGHHDDYSRPLDVRWLCAQHHADYHRELRKVSHDINDNEAAVGEGNNVAP